MMNDYVPDWSERSWWSAAYPYAAPDAPESDEAAWEDEHADDWEEW